MSSAIAKMIGKMAMKLMTETFIAKTIVEIMWSLAKSSKNKLDDKIVGAAAKALNVSVDK